MTARQMTTKASNVVNDTTPGFPGPPEAGPNFLKHLHEILVRGVQPPSHS